VENTYPLKKLEMQASSNSSLRSILAKLTTFKTQNKKPRIAAGLSDFDA
jgi:hypothetical protein